MTVTDDGPSAEELTDAQVAAVQASVDEARVQWVAIVARDSSVKAAMTGRFMADRHAVVELVASAYRNVGVSQRRAQQAAESWLIERRGVRSDLKFADELLAEMDAPGPRRGPGGPGST